MTAQSVPDCDVLIVGGGPTGASLALLQAGEQARVILADKDADIYPLPRAAYLDHEVMRIFLALGVAHDIMPTSRAASRYDFLSADRRVLMRFDGIVHAVFSTPQGQQAVSARYLVGTDGTRSAVRECAGIELDVLQFDEPWLVVDALVHDASRLPDVNLQICDPARHTTCLLMGDDVAMRESAWLQRTAATV